MATLETLVSFDGDDGNAPYGGVIVDAQGDLFGTTYAGGDSNFGTVFEIADNGGNYASTPTALVSFDSFDGSFPLGGLTFGPDGDLFGLTEYGGASQDGTAFEIADIAGNYASTPTTLVTFDGADGKYPLDGPIMDAGHNLFGTTSDGTSADGTVFEIPYSTGSYAGTPTTLVNFNFNNGEDPRGGLIADTQGDLFGTTYGGGASADGTVFELAFSNGSYAGTPTTLFTFDGGNGAHPTAGLVMDKSGDLFGTTSAGGASSDGTVFEIPYDNGSYEGPITLVSFSGADGAQPNSSLIIDGKGDLFGTTYGGGASSDGTVFEIAYSNGSYASTPTTLVSFSGSNGANPYAGLIADAQGDLFGTTPFGGDNGDGTVFEVTGSGFEPACYCRGTLILTDRGEVPVEDLVIGDWVVTVSGLSRPIKWIGRRAYDARFISGNRGILPIRIAKGALRPGVPARDLWVSPGHSLYFDGVLVQAEHLLNGATIIQALTVERLEYFHIELESHDIIFADGAPAESYVDCDNRLMFANGAEFVRHYLEDARPRWQFCLPRLEWGSVELTSIRAVLLERAETLGHSLDREPALHLIVDGEVVFPVSVAAGVYGFDIPAGSGTVAIASRSVVPAEVDAASRDTRLLGVPVERLVLYDGNLIIEIWHGHRVLCEGFHEDEHGHRWTDGLAQLPESLLHPFAGPFTINVHLVPSELGYRLSHAARVAAA